MTESMCGQFAFQKTRKESPLQFPQNFYVVQFHDGLALVPNNWLQSGKEQQVCFYPNYDLKKRLNKAIRNKEVPDLKNVKAGWAIYDVLRIFASADTFERGQEKLRLAENTSDVNTEDEESMKQTRRDRAIARKYVTSSDESSGTEVDLLSPLPNPKEFSGSQQLIHSETSTQIVASYEDPFIAPEKIKMVQIEKKKQEIIHQQETEMISKHKEKGTEDKNQDFNHNVNCIDKYEELTNKNNEDQSQKMLKEILKKVNRILVEVIHIDARLSRLENKTKLENNVNEEAFTFNTISSINELQLFEENLKNEEFFLKMRNYLKLKGGTNLQDVIKNIFKALIKDEILILYSWKGARGKHTFRNFKIVSLIIAVARLHDANSTEEIIKKLMINWIVQAPARVRRTADKEKNQTSHEHEHI